MFTKSKLVLAAALLAATSTVSLASNFDPDPANRYPSYSSPAGVGAPYLGISKGGFVSQDVAHQRHRALQSAPVRLHQGGNADSFQVDFNDRPSSPHAGGVG